MSMAAGRPLVQPYALDSVFGLQDYRDIPTHMHAEMTGRIQNDMIHIVTDGSGFYAGRLLDAVSQIVHPPSAAICPLP